METVKNTQSYEETLTGINIRNPFYDTKDKRQNNSVGINKRIGNINKSILMYEADMAKFNVIAYKGEEDISYNFNYDALLDYKIDYRIDQKMSKYQEQIGDLQNKFSSLLNNYSIMKQETSEIGIEAPNFDKAQEAINNMKDNDDIRFQIQCATRVINQIDILRKSNIFDENKRKLIAFLRTVMKINCDRKIFSEEQLGEFKNLFLILQCKDIEFDNLVNIEKRLRKSGLKTMISWE